MSFVALSVVTMTSSVLLMVGLSLRAMVRVKVRDTTGVAAEFAGAVKETLAPVPDRVTVGPSF